MSSVFLYHPLFLETGSLTEPWAHHFSETGKSLGSACPLPLVLRLQIYATTPPFFTQELAIQTPVLKLPWQALYPPNCLSGP